MADYLASPNRTTNPLAAQFGIYSKAEAEEFLVAGHLARMRPLLANDLERGLAALASEAGWEITDVLHIPVNTICLAIYACFVRFQLMRGGRHR